MEYHQRQTAIIHNLIDVCTTKAEQHIVQKISSTVDSTAQRLIREVQHCQHHSITEAQRRQALASLRFPEMNAKFNSLSEAHHGTFGWMFKTNNAQGSDNRDPDNNHDGKRAHGIMAEDECTDAPDTEMWDSFPDWLRSQRQVYWISGQAGSGKSTLVKFLQESRETAKLIPNGALIISHYFWKPGTHTQRGLKGLYCTLIHQLLVRNQDLVSDVLQRFLAHSEEKQYRSDWATRDLEHVLTRVLEHIETLVLIVIDGLDEA